MSSSSSSKKIQATVSGHKGRLVVSKVPAIEIDRTSMLPATPNNDSLITSAPITSLPFDATHEFVLMLIDRDSYKGLNFTELFSKRATVKDSSKMSVSALAEYNRLKKMSSVGTKLLTKLCDYPGLASVMRVGKQHLNTLETYTTKAPHLISCTVNILRSFEVTDVNENFLFRRFSTAFALKRRVTMRLYRKNHPDEVHYVYMLNFVTI